MFCTDPVSSCLCCSALISDADLTGCDHASQQWALQKYLKDASRSQLQKSEFYLLLNRLISSWWFWNDLCHSILFSGEEMCIKHELHWKKEKWSQIMDIFFLPFFPSLHLYAVFQVTLRSVYILPSVVSHLHPLEAERLVQKIWTRI